jgi:hypothetical protein
MNLNLQRLFLLGILLVSIPACAPTLENAGKVTRVSATEYVYSDGESNQLQVVLSRCSRDIRRDGVVNCWFYWNSNTNQKAELMIGSTFFSSLDESGVETPAVEFYGVNALDRKVVTYSDLSGVKYVLWEKREASRSLNDFFVSFKVPVGISKISRIYFDKRVEGIVFENTLIR